MKEVPIFNFILGIKTNTTYEFEIPRNSKFLSAGIFYGRIDLYFTGDPASTKEKRTFYVGTDKAPQSPEFTFVCMVQDIEFETHNGDTYPYRARRYFIFEKNS